MIFSLCKRGKLVTFIKCLFIAVVSFVSHILPLTFAGNLRFGFGLINNRISTSLIMKREADSEIESPEPPKKKHSSSSEEKSKSEKKHSSDHKSDKDKKDRRHSSKHKHSSKEKSSDDKSKREKHSSSSSDKKKRSDEKSKKDKHSSSSSSKHSSDKKKDHSSSKDKHSSSDKKHDKKKSSSSETASSSGSSSKSSFKKGTYKGVDGKYSYDGDVLTSDEDVRKRDGYTEPIPKKNSDGVLIFKDCDEFRPNLTPKEVLQAGSFGGTYFRPIKSGVTGLKYDKMWNELPQNWLEGLNIKKTISSSLYDESVNTYKAKCGGSLEMWYVESLKLKNFEYNVQFYVTGNPRAGLRKWTRMVGSCGIAGTYVQTYCLWVLI